MSKKGRNNKYTIEEINKVIERDNKQVILLSNIYRGAAKPLIFKCSICEHKFKRAWNSMNVPGSNCPVCGKNGVRLSKQEIIKLVESRGHTLKRFLKGTHRAGTRFIVVCARGHEISTTYRAFYKEEIKVGTSCCKECVRNGNTPKNIERRHMLKQTFLDLGYTIKDNAEIQTVHDKHFIYCINGHERYTNYNNIMETPDCGQCKGKIIKHTPESISNNLKEIGLELIGDFKTTQSSIRFRCDCGTEDTGYYHDILAGGRCYNCSVRRYWDYDAVKEFFAKNECVLLDKVYIKSKDPLSFICSCGNMSHKSFGEYKLRPYCYDCGLKKKAKGNQHPCWNPDLTDEDREHSRKYPEYKKWRSTVFERDNYTCQCCGDGRGGNLEAHHILNYSEHKELRLDINNGITLCQDCHIGFHMKYGFTSNNREQLEEYLKTNKINNNIA